MKTPICSNCKRDEAFFFRPYSGEKLCKRCFVISIKDKVKATIAEFNMLEYDDRIAVAVSGGKDSLSLLQILANIEQNYPKTSIIAISVDEGIKGYRDKALKIASENCKKLRIEHQIISFKKAYGLTQDEIIHNIQKKERANELTPCAYCGVLRRKLINIKAREVEADKVAMAHTLDDEVQTILLNILHGDPLRIAREKPITDLTHPELIQRIKPFCKIPEKETALYAYTRRLIFQDRPCPYSSKAMRNDTRVFLNRMEQKHAGIKFSIFRSMQRIRPALEMITEEIELKECSECGEQTTQSTCRACQLLQQM